MKKSFATACGGLLAAALAGGLRRTAQAPSAARSPDPFRRFAAVACPGRRALRLPPRPRAWCSRPGGPVPAGFRAASVTFVSAREGFAPGAAPCRHAPCTSVARTRDRGVSWRGLPAHLWCRSASLTAVTGPAVWGIRFATPGHGFVFGNGLWVTADGGEHWSAAAYPGGAVVSLAITDRQVLAVTARHGPDGLTGWTLLAARALAGGAVDPANGAGQPVPALGGIATQARGGGGRRTAPSCPGHQPTAA